MEKSLYISMGGAGNAMQQLAIITNNLANVNTTGFRSDASYLTPMKVSEQGMQTRTLAKLQGTYTNFNKGSILNTERDLDVALDGDGFLAVQSKSGKEAYTRAGSLQLQNGTLMTSTGETVIGNGGIISIPEAERLHLSNDGTITAKFPGSPDYVTIDRIKLVNPSTDTLKRGGDGLFYLADGQTAAQDPTVKIITGALEGSNVNAIETMTQLIDLSRSYEVHTNFMKTTSDNTSKANTILSLSR